MGTPSMKNLPRLSQGRTQGRLNVLKWRTFELTGWITGKRLKIDTCCECDAFDKHWILFSSMWHLQRLCNARPTVTFPVTEHHCRLAGSKLYCLVSEPLARGRYVKVKRSRVDLARWTPSRYTVEFTQNCYSCRIIITGFASTLWTIKGGRTLICDHNFGNGINWITYWWKWDTETV